MIVTTLYSCANMSVLVGGLLCFKGFEIVFSFYKACTYIYTHTVFRGKGGGGWGVGFVEFSRVLRVAFSLLSPTMSPKAL